MSTLKQKTVRGLKWQAVEIAGRQLLSLFVFTTLARLLDPVAFGQVAMVGIFLALASLLSDQGLGIALVQRKDLQPQHLHTAFWFTNTASLILFGLTQLLAPWVASLMADADLVPLLRWASLSLLITPLSTVQRSLLNRDMDFRRPAMRTLLANLVGGAVGIALALGGYGVWALVFQQVVAAAAGSAFLWAVSSYRPKLYFSLTHLRDLVGVSSGVLVTGLLWFVASRVDQFFIGRYLSATSLGAYNLGTRLSDLANTVAVQPIAGVSLPGLSKMGDDHPRMCRTIVRGIEVVSLIICPIFMGLAATSPSLVAFLFGEKWLFAVPVVRALAIYQLISAMFVFCVPAMIASGGMRPYVFVNFTWALGAVIAGWIGVQFSAIAVVIGMSANLLLTGLLALIFLQRRIGLPPSAYLRPCGLPMALSMTAFLVALVVENWTDRWLPSVGVLILQSASGATVYVLGVLILRPRGFVELVETIRPNWYSGRDAHVSSSSAVEDVAIKKLSDDNNTSNIKHSTL